MTNNNQIKYGILAILLIISILFFANNIIAKEGYCYLTLTNGQSVPVSPTFNYNCDHTQCQVCVNASDWYAPFNYCERLCDDNGNHSGGGEVSPLTLYANFPFTNGSIFKKQSFPLDIGTNYICSITLVDVEHQNQINLCPNCNNVKRSVNFPEGPNEIIIRAVKGVEVLEKRISFFIDNKKPRIIKTTPLPNKFISGDFTIVYDESNLVKTELFYGLKGSPVSTILNCESGLKQTCTQHIDLGAYEGKSIEYWFTITDVANNIVSSKPIKVFVDSLGPTINVFNFSVSKKNVDFYISVSDANMDKVIYYDNNDVRSKILCSNVKNKCSKKISFKTGHHVLNFIAVDKAGNTTPFTAEFDIA